MQNKDDNRGSQSLLFERLLRRRRQSGDFPQHTASRGHTLGNRETRGTDLITQSQHGAQVGQEGAVGCEDGCGQPSLARSPGPAWPRDSDRGY